MELDILKLMLENNTVFEVDNLLYIDLDEKKKRIVFFVE